MRDGGGNAPPLAVSLSSRRIYRRVAEPRLHGDTLQKSMRDLPSTQPASEENENAREAGREMTTPGYRSKTVEYMF